MEAEDWLWPPLKGSGGRWRRRSAAVTLRAHCRAIVVSLSFRPKKKEKERRKGKNSFPFFPFSFYDFNNYKSDVRALPLEYCMIRG